MGHAQNKLKIEQEMSVRNNHDIHGNPTDGLIDGVGIKINFRSEEEIDTPTGCTMLDVVKAVRLRLNWIQNFKPPAGEITSKCSEYAAALNHINKCMASLRRREERVLAERNGEVVS